jgi:hypothetical protein
MVDGMDLLIVADEVAEIACDTTDPATGRQLMALLTSILEATGLPPEDPGSGSRRILD